MKIELQIEIEGQPFRNGRTDRAAKRAETSVVLVRLAIDGEAGIGEARLPWESCGELIQKLGNRIEDVDLPPIVCAELLADLALNAQREQEIDRLHKRFRSIVGKSSKIAKL